MDCARRPQDTALGHMTLVLQDVLSPVLITSHTLYTPRDSERRKEKCRVQAGLTGSADPEPHPVPQRRPGMALTVEEDTSPPHPTPAWLPHHLLHPQGLSQPGLGG